MISGSYGSQIGRTSDNLTSVVWLDMYKRSMIEYCYPGICTYVSLNWIVWLFKVYTMNDS